MRTVGDILIVSGPPGAGKTSVSNLVAGTFKSGVHLESDYFYHSIQSSFVAPHLPEANDQNAVVIDIVTDAAATFAVAGYAVVVDGIVGPWFLDQIVDRLGADAPACHYLVLRPGREVGLNRVRSRDNVEDVSGAAVMWAQFVDLGRYESHVLAGSGSVDEVAKQARALLTSGSLRIS